MKIDAGRTPHPLCVVMITQGYFPVVGGAERQVTALSQELSRCGVEVHVLTRRYAGLKPAELLSGVYVHRLPVPGPKALASLSFTANALPLIHRIRPDILHAHELFSPTTTAVAAKEIEKIPVVATIHGGGEIRRLQQKWLGNTRLRVFRARVDRFIAIDREIDEHLERCGIPSSLRVSIPNGVDIAHFCPVSPEQKSRLKAELHLPGSLVAVYSGRLVPLKRVDRLIEAWKGLRVRVPDARLLILGSGPEEMRLKQIAFADGLDEAEVGIQFRGEIQDVAPYLQAADLFVLPSSREGLSVALLEAMSCGLPVIATDVGGNGDLVHHNQTGWLVSGQDSGLADLLAEALQRLLIDDALRTQMARAGREFVAQSYSLTHTAERLLELYLALLSSTYPGGQR